MSQSPAFEMLRELPHFRRVDPAVVARIAEGSRLRTFEKNEWLFRQGDPCHAFFAVRRGGVKVFRMTPDGREQVIHQIRAGHTLAEAALLTMHGYPANAMATESPTEVLEIGADPFLKLFDADRALARSMVGSLCGWLLRLVQRVEDLAVSSAGARIARFLLELPDTAGCSGVAAVTLPMAKKDLAAHLGITPETLSRQFGKWRDQGIIISRGREVSIEDPEALLAIAAGA